MKKQQKKMKISEDPETEDDTAYDEETDEEDSDQE